MDADLDELIDSPPVPKAPKVFAADPDEPINGPTAAQTVVADPSEPVEPVDPTKDWSFGQKVSAAGAAKVRSMGTAFDTLMRRVGGDKYKAMEVESAENFLGRKLSGAELEAVAQQGINAVTAPVETAPNKGLVNRLANIGGSLAVDVPAMVATGGSSAFGGLVGKAAPTMSRLLAASALPAASMTAGAVGGEVEASQQAGESPEMQYQRAKLAAAINAPAALASGATLGATSLPARLATTALTGGALGYAQSALGDVAQQREINQDAAGSNALLTGIMSAVLHGTFTPARAKQLAASTGKPVAEVQALAERAQVAASAAEVAPPSAAGVPKPKQFDLALELFKQDLADQAAKAPPAEASAPVSPEAAPAVQPEVPPAAKAPAPPVPVEPEVPPVATPEAPPPAAEAPVIPDTRHADLFKQGAPTAGTQLSLSELSALTPDQFAARYGDTSAPGWTSPQAESIRLGNEVSTPAQLAELKRLADQHTNAVTVSKPEALASGNPDRIQQLFSQELHADLFRKAYEHATGPERGLTAEQVAKGTGEATTQALRTERLPEVSAPVEQSSGGVQPPKPPRAGPAELGEPNSGPPRPPEWTPPVPADRWNQLTAHVRRLYRENVRDTGKAFVNAFSRATRMEGFKKTAQGQDLISRFSKAAVSEQRSVGELSEILTAAEKGLSRSDLRFIRSGEGAAAYQRGGVEAMPTPALKQYAAAWAEVAHQAAARTEGLGVEIADQRMDSGFRPFKEGNVKNYFPREGTKVFRDSMQRGKGEVYDAVVDMLKRKDIPLASLESLLDVDASGARRSGNIESPRLGEMEPTVTTKSGEVVKILNTNWQTAAEKYIQSVSRRLSIIENFGDHKEDGTWISGQKTAENIVDGAVKSLDGLGHKSEARVAADMWAALNGTQNQAALKWLRAHKLETPIATGEAIARTAMLTGATPSQFATGWVPLASRFGTAATAKSIARLESTHLGLDPKTAFEQRIPQQAGLLAVDMLGPKWTTKDLLKFGRESGATAKDTLGHSYTTEDIAGSAQKASNTVLSAVGFNASNRFLNSVAVLASAENLANSVQILREGKTGASRRAWGLDSESAAKGLRDNFDFTQADVERMAETGITQADLAQAMQRGTSKTNLFRETVFERPPWMNAVLARKMMAYTSYARAMGNTFSDAISSAKTGNVRPITTLLVGGTVGGAALKEFKDLLFRKPDEAPDKDALDTAARLLNYQMNASIYGLAGSYAQTAGYGIKRGDFSGPGSAMLDWWLKNAAGAVKSAKAGSLTPSYEAFARSTPVVKATDAWLGGPLSTKQGGPAAEDIRSKAKEFKASLPGKGPDDPKFKDLVSALSSDDRVAARAAIASLRRNYGGSEGVRRSLAEYGDYSFTGSKETEAKFLRTLTPDQRVTYNALLKARRDIARKGQAMVR